MSESKKVPIFISYGIGFCFAFGCLIILDLIGISFPQAYLCVEKVGICSVPLLGRLIEFFSSVHFWVFIVIYWLTYGIFCYYMRKKGYDL